jgi:hypothetical protein
LHDRERHLTGIDRISGIMSYGVLYRTISTPTQTKPETESHVIEYTVPRIAPTQTKPETESHVIEYTVPRIAPE